MYLLKASIMYAINFCCFRILVNSDLVQHRKVDFMLCTSISNNFQHLCVHEYFNAEYHLIEN